MDQGETSLLLDMTLDDITKLRRQELKSDASGKAAKKPPKSVAKAEPYVAGAKVCRNCLKTGHTAANCPQARVCLVCGKADHAKANCPKINETCRNCGQVGHLAGRCLKQSISEPETAPGEEKHCFVCGSQSHLKAACPHANKVCDICKKVGHLKAMCRSAQMPSGARAAVVAAVGRPILPAAETDTTPATVAVPKACFVCGSVAHERKNCPHKAHMCENCGKTGHFAALCTMKKV